MQRVSLNERKTGQYSLGKIFMVTVGAVKVYIVFGYKAAEKIIYMVAMLCAVLAFDIWGKKPQEILSKKSVGGLRDQLYVILTSFMTVQTN